LPATIGREPNNDIVFNHDSVSRYHCQLELDGDGSLVVHDLNSMNGTYVNDDKVSRSVLMTGDRLQFGAVIVRVEYISDIDPGKPRTKPLIGDVNITVPMRIKDLPRSTPSPPRKEWWQLW
jgi:pSer/pThr/pTyr-binding forkhead associated (FHA) protein